MLILVARCSQGEALMVEDRYEEARAALARAGKHPVVQAVRLCAPPLSSP